MTEKERSQTVTKTDKDSGKQTSTTNTETERDTNTTQPSDNRSGVEEGGAGSSTNPSGIGGNNENVSG